MISEIIAFALSSSTASYPSFSSLSYPFIYFFHCIFMAAIVPPMRIGLKANTRIACYQQMRRPPVRDTTIISIISTNVPANSDVMPFS
jgi:hypothetical protein